MDQKENVSIKLRLDIQNPSQMPGKIPLAAAARGADHDEFYSYEGKPNESRRARKKEGLFHNSLKELLAQMIHLL